MNRKPLFLSAALLLSGLLLVPWGRALGAPGPGPAPTPPVPQITVPAATAVPNFTYAPADDVVTVPDAKLKEALRNAAGLSAAAPLHRSDLAKLAGGLDLTGKGIANVEGLQWCVNLTGINLTDNKLTAIPSKFSQMTALETLVLDKNKFTKFPEALLTVPKLANLSLKGNGITKLPDNINTMSALVNLDVSSNKLETVPAKLGKLAKLKYLSLAGNELEAVPKELFQAPLLENLDLSSNWIDALPAEAAHAPKLATLNISANIIDALPKGIGAAPALKALYASRNRLTEVEASLLGGKVTTLLLDVNRLTALPKEMQGKSFDALSVEWNYIDMSAGSAARAIVDSVKAPAAKEYLRQLTPITNPQSVTTSTTVAMQWPQLSGGSQGDGSWKVVKYYVYSVNGESWKTVAELDGLATRYVVVDLAPNKNYEFMLGVEYSLKTSASEGITRCFTPVKGKTLAESATAPVVAGATAAPAASPAATKPAVTASATTTKAPTGATGASKGLVLALLIIASIAALALIGVLARMFLGQKKKNY